MTDFEKGIVGETAEHAISKMRDESGEVAVGNVLRRTCALIGEGACKQVCQLRANFDSDTTTRELFFEQPNECADNNLRNAIHKLGLEPKDVLMVNVTDNNVGFADKLDEYDVVQNPEGWRELPGYNAFFSREDEVKALGRRLADCADINFEFTDQDGKTVIGFEHGTRTNMFGQGEYRFERDGKKVSFTEYALGQALDHYGADPSSVSIKLAASIKGHNFTKHFDSREKMEGHIPGWYAAGYLKNVTNPAWKEGDPIVETDTWEADSRGMITDDIVTAMHNLGVPAKNFNTEGIIDPGDTRGAHSSHQFSARYGDTRDLYITYVKEGLEAFEQRLLEAAQKGEDLLQQPGPAAKAFKTLSETTPDAAAMMFANDDGLRGQDLINYWDTIGEGDGGFYDDIRENGCSSCGSHTPGCCDGCA